ncbi:hypothetical protein GBF38_009704 [Nibea albiflora]|uniref:Uncharacterized protein n=1 Tax=Nibea albiflora TaxID=240163 RepID=A0ACB7F808_NIBAL|nr:hypothetical protein GBF38_009704 [Nibea albiflora]
MFTLVVVGLHAMLGRCERRFALLSHSQLTGKFLLVGATERSSSSVLLLTSELFETRRSACSQQQQQQQQSRQ